MRNVIINRYEYVNGRLFNRYDINPRALRGQEAGTFMNVRGAKYRTVRIKGKRYLTHRLIWILFNGNIPDKYEIDHIDGDTLNNDLNNLRCVTPSINRRNMKMPNTNTSGYVGVSWDKKNKKWLASAFDIYGIQKNLGRFEDKEEANSVVVKFRTSQKYTNRHGENKK